MNKTRFKDNNLLILTVFSMGRKDDELNFQAISNLGLIYFKEKTNTKVKISPSKFKATILALSITLYVIFVLYPALF